MSTRVVAIANCICMRTSGVGFVAFMGSLRGGTCSFQANDVASVRARRVAPSRMDRAMARIAARVRPPDPGRKPHRMRMKFVGDKMSIEATSRDGKLWDATL